MAEVFEIEKRCLERYNERSGERLEIYGSRQLTVDVIAPWARMLLDHKMSSSTEQKIEKSIAKGIGKLKKNFRAGHGGSKSDNLEEARKKADDETFRAETLLAATKTIETTIIRLAERWKPNMSSFHMEVDQSRRQYGKEPELLPVILVNSLIKFYEQQVPNRIQLSIFPYRSGISSAGC